MRLFFLLLITPVLLAQPLPLTGQCESYDLEPFPCNNILSSWPIWVEPSLGLTQEYFTGLLFEGNPSVLDLVTPMDYHCARAFLTLMCPTFLRPCFKGTLPAFSSSSLLSQTNHIPKL